MAVHLLKSLLDRVSPKNLAPYDSEEPVFQEQDFVHDYLSRGADFTRYSLIIGLLFYSVFGILDAFILPDQKYQLWIIRYGVVNPVLIILIILSYIKSNRKFIEAYAVAALVIAGGGISVMVAIAEPPANYSYYSGIILVLMLGYGIVRIRFKWAALAGWLNVVIYEVISIFIISTPREVLINNNFFFISANLIGMISCYAIEYYIRRNYYYARLLELEKENVHSLNQNLEEMVRTRTAELVRVNESLQSEIDGRNLAEKERAALEQKLLQAQKMESLGNFAGGIAHDFNNILTSVLGYTEMTLEMAGEDSPLYSPLQMIYSSSERAAELVSQILSFARKSERKKEPVRPDLVLMEVLKFVRSSVPSTIEVHHHIRSKSSIWGNGIHLYQVFLNLLTNAIHAMHTEGGRLDIRMDDIVCRPLKDEQSMPVSDKVIEIEFSDTGTGIQPEYLDSIFEPYFTTKETGEGTGLGLAVVHGIVESFGGTIEVSSTPGQGTSFLIHFPVVELSMEQENRIQKEQLNGKERILLVDDDTAIADVGRILLTSLGYRVTTETDSRQALELFRKNPENFDLVVTDMMMPGMTGEKLDQELRRLRSDIPVIICSGYGLKSSHSGSEQYKSYLNKPYSRNAIAAEIRRLLKRAGT